MSVARQQPAPSRSERPPSGSRKALLRAMGHLRSHRRDALGAVLSLVLVSAASLLSPQLVRFAIDGGIAGHRPRVILFATLALVGVAAVRGLFNFSQGYLAERASQGVAFDLREALFAQIQRLSFSYYDQVHTGQLLTRVTNDVEQIRTFAGSGVIQLVNTALMILGTAVLLFAMNGRLALLALLIVPAIVTLLFRFMRRLGPLFGKSQQILGQLNSVLQEGLTGLKVVRAFAQEEHEARRFGAVNETLLATNLETVRTLGNHFPLVFLCSNLGTLAVVWFGGWQVIGGKLTVGELIAFNTYLTFLLMPLFSLGFFAAGFSRAGASASRVYEVLDSPIDVADAENARALGPVQGAISFEDVHFRYPGSEQPVLRGVTFRIEPGQTVAVLGTTGSGKSTLSSLVPRFYDPTSGTVRVDGEDLRAVTLSSLRSQIGVVMQDALIFSGTVRENIAYGRPDASLEEIVGAAQAAQAAEFIEQLPQRYDTVVGERGIGLSGGQRQRLAIARALVVQPRILILDESTSAVDAGTEGLILAALDRLLREGRHTAFVIAQRLSTVRSADRILVLDQGRIAAQGTHEELLQQSELYNEILGSQLEGGAASAKEARG